VLLFQISHQWRVAYLAAHSSYWAADLLFWRFLGCVPPLINQCGAVQHSATEDQESGAPEQWRQGGGESGVCFTTLSEQVQQCCQTGLQLTVPLGSQVLLFQISHRSQFSLQGCKPAIHLRWCVCREWTSVVLRTRCHVQPSRIRGPSDGSDGRASLY
jgi:hypothetical protein